MYNAYTRSNSTKARTNNKRIESEQKNASTKAVFCIKCGRKNNIASTYCTGCGTRLVTEKNIKEESEKKREKEKEEAFNKVTINNFSSKISEAVFIVAKVITKTSIVSLRPKQPTTYDSYTTKAFIILGGSLRYESDVSDEVKKKILKDLDTDIEINQVAWTTQKLVSSELRNKGWSAAFFGSLWYIWPTNGSTSKSLITIDYKSNKAMKNILVGEKYLREDMERDESHDVGSSIIGAIILLMLLVFCIIFLTSK